MSLNCGSLDPIQSLTLKKLTMLGNIEPAEDYTYDCGTSTKRWLNIRSSIALITSYIAPSKIIGLKVFTTAPALAGMQVGEIALGNGTGGTGENEWFIKVSATHIARFVRDSDITE